ncbi:MAG: hypothetical protein AB7G21_06375 [Dehalococcoidia bacterium]
MRAALLLALAAAVLLAGCGEAPVPVAQVTRTFAPGAGYATPRAEAGTVAPSLPRAECDIQNSTLQDSGLPLLEMSPVSPRRGEVVTVTAERLPPGPRTITLMTPHQRDVSIDVTVASDGRLRATFPMPPVVAGQCAMLVLDGVGVQSLGFPVRE